MVSNSGEDTENGISRIAANLSQLQNEINEAAALSGRTPDSVRLVAVSKTVGLTEIAWAQAAGITDFGENRSKDLQERQTAYPQAAWHFIGRIQSNKAKDFVGRTVLVHSVSSEHVLSEINKRAEALGIVQAILVEVNTSGEQSKDGVSAADLPGLLEAASKLSAVRVDGLMTIAPIADDDSIRRCFAYLHRARDDMQQLFKAAPNLPLLELSMGMSDDFRLAVMEGATIVRIGRSIWRGLAQEPDPANL
ncbi:MAG: YggS family pyridoxal phosphate-dependent enzyme [Coriobacteriia bacterium]|nr:YggS family pyridoxal phosphate-dependent enzyme [Coriobacteriia bacterium]